MLCLNSTNAKPLLFPVCLFLGRWHSLTGPNFSKSCLRAEISEKPWKIAMTSQWHNLTPGCWSYHRDRRLQQCNSHKKGLLTCKMVQMTVALCQAWKPAVQLRCQSLIKHILGQRWNATSSKGIAGPSSLSITFGHDMTEIEIIAYMQLCMCETR